MVTLGGWVFCVSEVPLYLRGFEVEQEGDPAALLRPCLLLRCYSHHQIDRSDLQ